MSVFVDTGCFLHITTQTRTDTTKQSPRSTNSSIPSSMK